jgi:L-ascorbate metabolism protein UlaG (beta-lactamase superfamily)
LTYFTCRSLPVPGACGSRRILFDPGTYSADFEELTGLDAVLITHEHPDHHDAERLARLAAANPQARVVTVADISNSVDRVLAEVHVEWVLYGLINEYSRAA